MKRYKNILDCCCRDVLCYINVSVCTGSTAAQLVFMQFSSVCSRADAGVCVPAWSLPVMWHSIQPLPPSHFPFPPRSCISAISSEVNVSAHTLVWLWWVIPGLPTPKPEMKPGKQRRESDRERINQDGPATRAASRLARHGGPDRNHLVSILNCWTLLTPAGCVMQRWNCKYTEEEKLNKEKETSTWRVAAFSREWTIRRVINGNIKGEADAENLDTKSKKYTEKSLRVS